MPVDRGQIDQQLHAIGEGERWWEDREFRSLPYVLFPEERIRGLARGKLLGRRRPRIVPAAWWLIVVTDQRILCMKQDRVARRQIEVGASQIVRMRDRSLLRTVQVTLETTTKRLRIRLRREDAVGILTALNQLVPRPALQQLPPDLEPLAWIPGFTTVASLPAVAGLVSKVSMLSPPAPPEPGRLIRLENTVTELQGEVDRLQQQVAFLEELLEKRAAEGLFGESSPT